MNLASRLAKYACKIELQPYLYMDADQKLATRMSDHGHQTWESRKKTNAKTKNNKAREVSHL
jgi:hypothetical protein